MVFSSFEFLFVFLPLCVAGYYAVMALRKWPGSVSLSLSLSLYLFIVSLIFYGYWNPKNLLVIGISILLNFCVGKLIASDSKCRKFLFITGIAANLGLLFYFKYTNFFISIADDLGCGLQPLDIVLPLGISFFTFQQIAYLSDIYTGKFDPSAEGLVSYCCFVCFFPQLVAGPIVHHKEMMPQFSDEENQRVNWQNIYDGLVLLSIGLAKKVLIADRLSPVVGYGFDSAQALSFFDACFVSIAYTLQLYFDFSGYSDMAVGCALFFNIHLPQNFDSPYRSTDIQVFWRRWHMTLSRWLRDYLYIPLGGNRNGAGATLRNLFVTFLLAGLWHGAAWTFVLWGAMHGLALIVHRIWSKHFGKKMPLLLAWGVTFAFVNAAWIVFRATDFSCVAKFMRGFAGCNGLSPSVELKIVGGDAIGGFPHSFTVYTAFLAFAFLLSFGADVFSGKCRSDVCLRYPVVPALLFCLSVITLACSFSPEFLYFQF